MENLARLIRTIHTAKSYLLLGELEYRELLKERYGVSSSKALSASQAQDLVGYFRSIGFGKRKRVWTCTLCRPYLKKEGIPADTIFAASPSQLAVIDVLKNAVKWKHPQGYERWLRKYFGLMEIKLSPEASRVITALKGLIRSQKTCNGCAWKFDTGEPTNKQ